MSGDKKQILSRHLIKRPEKNGNPIGFLISIILLLRTGDLRQVLRNFLVGFPVGFYQIFSFVWADSFSLAGGNWIL